MVVYGPPEIVTINVTTKCFAACRYCHYWYAPEEKTANWPDLVEYVRSASALGTKVIRISGGEPLTHSDLPELVDLVDDLGMVSMVCTSAWQQLPALLALVDAGLDIMAISIDLLDAAEFRKLRGYSIEPVLANLEALAAVRAAKRFEIVISTVLTRVNARSLGSLLALVKERDLLLSVTPFQGSGLNPKLLEGIAFSTGDRASIESTVAQLKEEAQHGLRLLNSDRFLDGFADFMTQGMLPQGHVCTAGEKEAIITVDGELKLCHSLEPLSGSSLQALWYSDQAEQIRSRMKDLACPRCWLSCHADERRHVPHTYGSTELESLL